MRRRWSASISIAATVLAGLPVLAITTPAAAASVSGDTYVLTQTKIVDTRSGLGARKAALGAGKTLAVQVAGKGGVPSSGAAAAVLQLTAISSTRATSLTVWPYGTSRPATPNLIAAPGRSSSVQVNSKLGSGRVNVYNSAGSVQLTVQTEGWSTDGSTGAAGAQLMTLSPKRILDTRAGLGARKAAVGAGKTLTFTVAGKGGVPSTGVTGVALDVTGLSATATTALTVFPAGTRRPVTPNVYLTKGRTVAGEVLTKLGSGKVSIYNSAGTVQIAADVQGAFRTSYAAGSRLTSLRPARLMHAKVAAGKTAVVAVTGHGGVPARAVATALSLTGAAATKTAALTVYPYGSARPATPNVYLTAGASATNQVLARLGTAGKVAVYNSAGSTTVSVDAQGAYVPAATTPPTNPPSAITTTGAHSLYEQSQWLFTGANAPQTGVAAGVIKPELIGVVRGKVTTKAGAAASGVALSILGHPEFGGTKTDSDGAFSMAVNAGGPLTVNYDLSGFTSSQRMVQTKAQQYAWAPAVVLLPVDTKVTAISSVATGETAAVSSTVTDSDGSRTNAVLFPAGTDATATKPDGSTVNLPDTLHVRATEYTVGTTGPQQMPGTLPASSGYTYAVDLTVDEAENIDATNVTFSKPLANYVDNFLDFPVGTAVPAGYYDEQKAVWVASQNGDVVKLLSVDGSGRAVLDTDGDNQADSSSQYSILGITDAERTRLATTYPVGKTLWRVPITHFTPWDYNWPYGPPDDATNWEKTCEAAGGSPARCHEDAEKLKEKYCDKEGSIIGCQNQTLGESVPVTGTNLHLRYSSSAVPGRTTNRRITIPLTFSSMPASFVGGLATIDVAGEHFEHPFSASPNQSWTFVWDGLDGYGRPVNGEQEADIQIGYEYPAVYKESQSALQDSFALAGTDDLTGNHTRQTVVIWHSLTSHVGALRPDSAGLGDWEFDVHHSYDPQTQTVYDGDGTTRTAGVTAQGVIDTVKTTGSAMVDPQDAVAGADGTVYVADPGADRIWKVSPAGVISVFAGDGTEGYKGDDGPATSANLFDPTYVAIGPDGSVYVTDGSHSQISRVRRVRPDGIITTIAGTFNDTFNGDGINATDANLLNPQGVAVGSDGSVYVADTGDARVRRINPNGIITTVAGNGTDGDDGDGGPAAQATIDPVDIAVGSDGTVYVSTSSGTIRAITPNGVIKRIAGNPLAPDGSDGDALAANINPAYLTATPDGNLLFTDNFNNRLREVAPDGQLSTVSGKGDCGIDDQGDGGPPTSAPLCQPRGIAVTATATTIVENDGFDHIDLRRIGSIWPGFQLGDTTLASPDGTQLWVFDANGREKRAIDAVSGAVVWQFAYDTSGRLSSVADGYGNTTTIQRDSTGTATSITAPGGEVTALAFDTNHYLTSIADPLGDAVTMGYGNGGLLTSYTDPDNHTTTFGYDSEGRLVSDTEPDGGVTTLARTATTDSTTITTTEPNGQTTVYFDKVNDDGSGLSRRTDAAGGITTLVTSADGLKSTRTDPDGTHIDMTYAPDKRWGMQAPFAAKITYTLPSNKTYTDTATQDVTLSDATNPLSLVSLTTTETRGGKTTTRTYDAATRTQTTTTPAGRTSVLVLNANALPASFTPDSQLDPVTWTYDSHGRAMSVSQGSRSTSYGYDGHGRVSSRTNDDGVTSYGYDAADRLTSTTTPGGEVYQFGYDASGNRTSVTMPGGKVHTLAYSKRGELTGYTPPGNAAYQRSYDHTGRVQTATLPSAAVESFSYDSGDRDTGLSYPEAATSLTYAGATSRVATESWTPTAGTADQTAYTYDGPFVATAATTGKSVASFAYSYDADQNLSQVKVDSGSDSVTRNLTRDDDGLVVGDGPFTIDRSGPQGLTTGVGDGTLSTSMSYDASAKPTTRSTTVNGTAAYASTLQWSGAERVSSFAQDDGTTQSTDDYTYDADGRLTGVSEGGNAVAAYTYDDRGNRLTSGDPNDPTAATYDNQDRLTSLGGVSYSFDNDGYLTGRGADTFSYSRRGELLAAHVGASTITYAYDSRQRRVSRTEGGQTTQYFYGNPEVATEVTAMRAPDGTFTQLYYDGSRHLYAMQRGASMFYVATDTLGSPRVVTDSTGAVVDRIDYDAWGQTTSESAPSFGLVIGFAGGIRDDVTGLVRFGFRDYDPAAGRWTARDSLIYDGHTPNLYEYVGNQPTTLVDPTGQWGFNIGGSICVIACLEVSVNIGSNGMSVCGGTGLGLGESADVGFTPGKVETDSGLYEKAELGIGPVDVSIRHFDGLCGGKTDVEGCAGPVCINQDTFKHGQFNAKAPELEDPHEPPKKLSESLEASATIGGCVGHKW